MSGFAKFLKESNHGFPFTDVISQNKYLYNLVLELQEMLITEFDCEVLVKTTKDISYSPCVIYTLLISAGLVKPLIRVNYNKANEIEFMVEIILSFVCLLNISIFIEPCFTFSRKYTAAKGLEIFLDFI